MCIVFVLWLYCRYYLEDVIEETLAMIVELGKAKALRAVQSFVPQYSYCNPKD